MSEKRFKIYQDSIRKFESNRIWGVKSETNSLEPYMTFKEAEKCCELLNEQQDKITELEVEWTDCKNRKEQSEYNLQKRVDEQQDNITELEKNFDDIVKWASEIAKRNVVLDEQIGQLQRENSACEYGQKSLMEEMKNNDEALEKIWEIMKDLYGVKDE